MSYSKFYSAFFRSFFSGSLYRDVARNWRGLGFTYLFIVQSICLVFLLFRLHLSLSEYIKTELPPILEQIPTITITNGTASTEENRPYFIISPTDEELLAVIDTTEQYTSLEQTEARILLTKREVIFERNQYETRTFSFRDLDSLKIDRLLMDNFLKTIQRYLAIVVYPFVLLYYFGYRIIQVLLYALMGLIMARILQIQVSYLIMIRLVSVAISPVLFLEAIFRLFGIPFLPGWSLIGVFVVFCYIYFALKANTRNSLS